MAHHRGPKTITQDLVFHYDTGNEKSFAGEPTTNYIPQTYDYSLYAYASGPVDTTAYNEYNTPVSVKRYTITNAINTARAAIFPSTTTGVFYTFSFKWKYNGTVTSSPSIAVSAFKGNPETNNNSFTSETSNTISIGNGWYLTTYIFNFSSNPTGGCILTFGISTGSNTAYVNETFDIYQAQFEIKNHRTQYTLGTRSNTQALLDLSKRSVMTVANASFDSNAMLNFDGTNDYIQLTSFTQPTNYITCEAWINPQDSVTPGTIRGGVISSTNSMYLGIFDSADGGSTFGSHWAVQTSTGARPSNTNGQIPRNQWTHLVGTYNGSVSRTYINGVEIWNASLTGTIPSATYYIGTYGGSIVDDTHNFNGFISVAKIYNRALTAEQVLQNFNASKRRFGL